MRIINAVNPLSTHEAFLARQSLAKIYGGELQARKALQETKIEGLFLALGETNPGTPMRQTISDGITAAFSLREDILAELSELNA